MQPVPLLSVLTAFYFNQDEPAMYVVCLVFVQLVLGVVEYHYPVRDTWIQPAKEKTVLITIAMFVVDTGNVVSGWHHEVLGPPLSELRQALHLDIWPHHWPVMTQAFIAYCNLRLSTRGIGLFFTTNAYAIRHHSGTGW